MKTRDHDLHQLFEYEVQSYPPSLSNLGEVHLPSAKSDLLACLEQSDNLHPPHSYDCQILDGAAVVHFLWPVGNATFGDYADTTFIPYINQQLNHAKRVDVVWDAYHPDSLKAVTRQKRGEGVRRKVSEQVKLPQNWGDFLRDSRNKKELFCLLTTKLQQHSFADGKQVYATVGDSFTFFNLFVFRSCVVLSGGFGLWDVCWNVSGWVWIFWFPSGAILENTIVVLILSRPRLLVDVNEV